MGESIKVAAGCLEGGVLSSLLWNLVVDERLIRLSNRGFYALEYSDDVAIEHMVYSMKQSGNASRMQMALSLVTRWAEKEH